MATTRQKTTKAEPLLGNSTEIGEATITVAEWITNLSEEDSERFTASWQKYQAGVAPTVAALIEFFGDDPSLVPSNNAFFSNGYIHFKRKTEGDEMTTSGYADLIPPKLVPYPEGLTFELASAAVLYDHWRLTR